MSTQDIETTKDIGIVGILFTLIVIGLGVAGVVWLGFVMTGHDFGNQVSQEHRAAEWVGEKTPPKAPIKIIVKNGSGCIKIDHVRIEGDHLRILTHRVCGVSGDYAEVHWRVVANNTVIDSGYTNWQVTASDVGQFSEFIPDIQTDDRVTEIDVNNRSQLD